MTNELGGPPTGQDRPSGGESVATAPPAAGRGNLVRNVVLMMAVLVLLLVLAGAFVVVSQAATSDRVKASHAAIDRLRADHLVSEARLNTISADLGASTDVAKNQAAYTKVTTELEALKVSNSADLAVIDQANGKVQDRSILTMLSADQLDAENRRLHSYREAILIEQGGIDTMKQQYAQAIDLEAVLGQWQPLSADLKAADVAAAQRDYALPSGSLDRVIAEANATPGTPGKFKELVALFRTHLNDTKALLDGAHALSQAKVDAAAAALERDLAAEAAFDTPGLQQQYQDLQNQVFEKVDAALKKGE